MKANKILLCIAKCFEIYRFGEITALMHIHDLSSQFPTLRLITISNLIEDEIAIAPKLHNIAIEDPSVKLKSFCPAVTRHVLIADANA
jgi:hypothetical protein